MNARVAGLVVVAACGSSRAMPDATVTDVVGVDLVVGATNTLGYVDFTWAAGSPRFPQPGECATTETDGVATSATCFGGLLVAGTPLHTIESKPQNPFAGAAIAGDATVTVIDCGATAEAPVHFGTYPNVDSYDAKLVGDDLVVTWSAPGATSVLVGANGGTGLFACHTTDTSGQHVFPGYGGAAEVGAEVQALREPEVTSTDLGDIRVWYGNLVYPTVVRQ